MVGKLPPVKAQSTTDTMKQPNQIKKRILYATLVTSIVWLLAVVFNVWDSLRGDYGWRWGYDFPEQITEILPITAAVGIYLAGAYFLIRRINAAWLVLWAIIMGLPIMYGALFTHTPDVPNTLYLRTLSSGATGWHFAGMQMDERGADEMLETWPEVMEGFKIYSAHVAISPPGMAVSYHWANQTFEGIPVVSDELGPPLRAEQCHNYRFNEKSNAQFTTSALGGLLSPLITLLAVIPLFWLGKRYFSPQAARWAVLWWPLVPAVLMFQPYPSVIYPALTIPMVLALMYGLTSSNRLWMVIAGVLMSIASFMNFSILPLLLVAGLLALGIFFTQREANGWSWWWPFEMGMWYGVGLLTVWIGYYLLYGVTFFEILDATFSSHLDLDRPYIPWLFLHLYDFGFFLGWPMLIAATFGLWALMRLAKHFTELSAGTVLGITIFLTLLILDVSGTARGETGRVWLFFMPYMLLLGGAAMTRVFDQQTAWITTSVQAIIVIGLAAVIPTIGTGLDAPPETPTWAAISPVPYIATEAIYDDTIQLKSFSGYVDTEENLLKIWVQWTSSDYVEIPYYVGILPVAPDSTPQEAYVAQPFNDGDLPMTCWQPERGTIEDYYEIPITEVAGGDWWASVQLLTRTGEALPVRLAQGTTDQQTGIGPFQQLK